jgi:CRP-like cAMP-binding protein
VQRRKSIKASALIGAHTRSRARPCTFARLDARDRRNAKLIARFLPGTIAEIADRAGMNRQYVRQIVSELAAGGWVRVAPKKVGIRREAIVMKGEHR